jgi:DNA-binding NarL/FixJ family response regulator
VDQAITVAVIDGNPRTRQELVRRLGQVPGIALIGETADRDEALALVADRRPEVVVLDPRHIAPDGVAYLRRLARAAPEAGVVILTTFITGQERRELRWAGAREILLKEIGSDALVRAIRRAAAQPAIQTPGSLGEGEWP